MNEENKPDKADQGALPEREPTLEEAAAQFAKDTAPVAPKNLGGMVNPFAAPDADMKKTLHDAGIDYVAESLREQGKEKQQEYAEQAKKPAAPTAEEAHISNLIRDKKFTIKPLRSLHGDAAEQIEKQKASLISIKMAEETKRRELAAETQPANVSIKVVSVALSVLLVGMGAATAFVFNKYSGEEKPAVPVYSSLMPYDERKEVNIGSGGREGVISLFANERAAAAAAPNQVVFLELNENGGGVTVRRLLETLKAEAPDRLVRSFDDAFMAGLYSTEKMNPFLLMKVESFDNAFSGMLAWEDRIAKDLLPIFSSEQAMMREVQVPVEAPAMAATTTATTTRPAYQTMIVVERPVFEDLIVRNLDTRAVRSPAGEIVMIYSFLDRTTLLITTDERSFQGIVDRIRTSRIIR